MSEANHIMPEGLDYNQITDNIYIGTNACCRTHLDEKLKESGFQADISLEGERIDAPYGVEFFLWLPTKNSTAPSPEQFELGIKNLKHFEDKNIKVYVHCQFGHGRAPTLVAGYLIREKGMSAEQAVAFIKERRTVIHLEEIQIEALRKLENI